MFGIRCSNSFGRLTQTHSHTCRPKSNSKTVNVFILANASEYCLLNGQHVYFMPFKMTNERIHAHTNHRHSARVCVWARSRKYWFVLDENYTMRPPVTIHKTHKHAIILRLCNLCGSILYIRKHKIASYCRTNEYQSVGKHNFFRLAEILSCMGYMFGCQCIWRKSFSHCIFICLTLYRIVCICVRVCVCVHSEAKCSTNIYWTWSSSFCHQK